MLFRPGDAVEMAAAWKLAVESKENPTALIFNKTKMLKQWQEVQ